MFDRLVIMSGPDAKREHYLNFDEGPVVFGRSHAQANFAIPDPQVSRVHFQIERRGAQTWVVDLGSASGTLVNGRKVSEQQLMSGDIVRAGETQLKFVPAGMSAGPVAEDAEDRLEALTGRTVSHFEVGPLIAKGTSACIFKATDTDNDQTVALKVLQPEMAKSEDEMQRFIRAMKTIMPLKHPNLIAMYGAGRKGMHCWVSMEYVDGDNLTSLIDRVGKEGRLDWKFALRVAVHISRALTYACENSIIHRNITPKNIIVRKKDQTALLGDLMLAKALEGTLAAQITKPGQMVGDVHYMSPERTKTDGQVDGRSDIYSLGATIYALLTGRPPHEGLTLVETLQKLRSEEPQHPSEVEPKIPKDVDAAIMKMLAKDPTKRFQTAAELTAALEQLAKKHGVVV